MINNITSKTMTASLTLLLSVLMLNHINAAQLRHRMLPCEDACTHGDNDQTISQETGIAIAATFGTFFLIIICCSCFTHRCDRFMRQTTTPTVQEPTLTQRLVTQGSSSAAGLGSEMVTPVASRQVSVDHNNGNQSKLTSDIEADNGVRAFRC